MKVIIIVILLMVPPLCGGMGVYYELRSPGLRKKQLLGRPLFFFLPPVIIKVFKPKGYFRQIVI
jgi:hypothetical protein